MSWILEEDDCIDKEKESTKELLRLINPNFWNLNRENNADVDIEVGFEELMLSISEHTKEDLDTITTFKFYTLIKYINKKQSDG